MSTCIIEYGSSLLAPEFFKRHFLKNYYNEEGTFEFILINRAADRQYLMSSRLTGGACLRRWFYPLRAFIVQVFALVCVFASPFTAPAFASTVENERFKNISISVCDDENEWPPYIFFERTGGKKGDKIAGFSIDVIEDIFSRHQIRYSITMLPWARCLLEVNNGSRYQMLLGLTKSPEREINYWISQRYYSTQTYYYFSRKKYPQGLAIKAMADLKKYRICGIHGYNINYVGYPGFFKPGEIDQGAKTFESLIAKIHLQRCDVFLEQYQAMQGYALIGKPFLEDPELGREPMPGLLPSSFHFALSRHYVHGEHLLQLIDQELKHMESTGRLKELWKKRVPK